MVIWLFCNQKGEHFSEKPLSIDVSHENILHMSQYKVLKHISVMIRSFVINKYSQAFAVPWVCLQFIVVFPDHTHLQFFILKKKIKGWNEHL